MMNFGFYRNPHDGQNWEVFMLRLSDLVRAKALTVEQAITVWPLAWPYLLHRVLPQWSTHEPYLKNCDVIPPSLQTLHTVWCVLQATAPHLSSYDLLNTSILVDDEVIVCWDVLDEACKPVEYGFQICNRNIWWMVDYGQEFEKIKLDDVPEYFQQRIKGRIADMS